MRLPQGNCGGELPEQRPGGRAGGLTGGFWMGYPGGRFCAAAWEKAQRSRGLQADGVGAERVNSLIGYFRVAWKPKGSRVSAAGGAIGGRDTAEAGEEG